MAINEQTSVLELATLVSQALEDAGVSATLSGGGAISIYTENEYTSKDLDFVCSERREKLVEVLEPLGFGLASDRRHFAHPDTALYLEFPLGPLAFGNRQVSQRDVPTMESNWGSLRVITPTMCVMDRLAAFWHWNDRQSWDQALMVARRHDLDYEDLIAYAKDEGADKSDIDKLLQEVRGEHF